MKVLRVLVCDDVDDIRYLLRASLESDPSFEVVGEAANGFEAIDRATDLQPDIVVLDLVMPEMDGLQALPRIKAACPESRVFVLSAFEWAGSVADLIKLGAEAYLRKGTSLTKIMAALKAPAIAS